MPLVAEQRVVHRPELALRRRDFGSEGRLERTRMHFFERKVAPHETHPAAEALEEELYRRRRLLAVRAFEVAVLDERDRGVRGTEVVVLRVDRDGELEALHFFFRAYSSQRCMAAGVNSACGWSPPMMNIKRCSLPGSS